MDKNITIEKLHLALQLLKDWGEDVLVDAALEEAEKIIEKNNDTNNKNK